MVRVSAARGYAAATVAEVSAAAGVEEAAFRLHFADREECFLAAYEAVSDVLVARVAVAYEAADGLPWAERIAVGLRALVRLLAGEAEIARLAIVEVTAIPGDARLRYGQALDRFVPFLAQGREESTQAGALPAETERFAIGAAASLIFDEFRAGRGAELESILPDLLFALTMPYLGAEAAEAEMQKSYN
jgi:AcrR family transcriptional regulator